MLPQRKDKTKKGKQKRSIFGGKDDAKELSQGSKLLKKGKLPRLAHASVLHICKFIKVDNAEEQRYHSNEDFVIF